jgi:hypothetical protein
LPKHGCLCGVDGEDRDVVQSGRQRQKGLFNLSSEIA